LEVRVLLPQVLLVTQLALQDFDQLVCRLVRTDLLAQLAALRIQESYLLLHLELSLKLTQHPQPLLLNFDQQQESLAVAYLMSHNYASKLAQK
jgi:hypothetical protein